jgi:hypothetical protein
MRVFGEVPGNLVLMWRSCEKFDLLLIDKEGGTQFHFACGDI